MQTIDVLSEDIKEWYETSAVQKRIFAINAMNPCSLNYNITFMMTFNGNFHKERFKNALNKSVNNNPMLNARFKEINGGIKYSVFCENQENYEFIEGLPCNNITFNEFKNFHLDSFVQPFDLLHDVLYRIRIVKYRDDITVAFMDFHHIIFDGSSVRTFISDLVDVYNENFVKINKNKYSDFVDWHNKTLQSSEYDEKKVFWEEMFSEPSNLCDRLVDYPNKRSKNYEADELKTQVYNKKDIEDYCKELRCTKFAFFVAALNITLSRLTYQSDITIGTVSSGRKAEEFQSLTGMFVNILPLRNYVNENQSIKDFIQQVHKNNRAALKNSDVQYETIIELSKTKRQDNPLFDIFLRYQETYRELLTLQGLECCVEEILPSNCIFDFQILIDECRNDFEITISYAHELYKRSTIELFQKTFIKVINTIISESSLLLGDIDLVDMEEKALIIGEFNNTYSEYPKEKTVAKLFEEQVKKTPNHIAVTFEDEEITYRELNQRANALAHKLRSLGVKPDDYVTIMAERSIEMIVGIYGVIKAGGAYVPMDPTYPKDRIEYMLEDCTPKAVLTYKAEIETAIPVIDLAEHSVFIGEEENPIQVNQSSDLLYVIYTSGTTGKPKGVMIENRGVANLRNYFIKSLQVKEGEAVLQFANIIFDGSVWEMNMALLTGGRLVIANKAEREDTKEFVKIANREKISISTIPPVFYSDMDEFIPNVVITAGSESNRGMVEKVVRNSKYINAYGPSECTVAATHWECDSNDIVPERIPIGKPILNTKVYILNNKKLCGIGVPGELCIAGDGVARGYLNRPELTAEKFIDNPFGEGKLYRSGDLARWLPDGNIEYLGRMDEQVKIRGFRIELGEIESVIRRVEGVTDVAVIVREDKNGEKAVRAYVTAENELSISDIKEVIRKELPEYMMPAYMMQIEKIPVTRNGKLDKRALPEIEVKSEKEYIAPRNETEEIVCEIFSELLDVEKISVKDNFFELGGHSLKATRLANRIEAETGKTMSLKEILSNPTVENLAEIMTGKKAEEYMPIPTAEIKAYYPMSSTQKRIYLLNQIDENSTAYNIPQSLKGTGDIRINDLKAAMQGLINRHEILRSVFVMIDGEPVQKIKETMELDFTLVEDERMDQKELMDRFIRPFDLSEGPLFRMEVVKKNDGYLLCIDMHHIISDGMSMVTFIKELTTLYNKENVKPLTHQYKDYSEWMRNRDLSEQKTYWLSQFEEEAPILDMPLDYTRPLQQSFVGASVYELTGKELASKIKAFTEKNKVTEYMVFLSAAMILLGKYSRQEDIVIGSPISARTHKDTENMLGMFVNTLAMRGRPEGQKTYRQFLEEIKESCLHAYENQEYPFEELVEEVVVHRDMSRNPLFDVMLVLQNNEHVELDLNGSKAESTGVEFTAAKFDLTFSIYEVENTYKMVLEYCTDLYKQESAERLLTHLINIMNQVVSNPTIKLNEIDVITKEERALVTKGFNDTYSAYPKEKTVVELFEEQVEKTPNHIAVTFEDEEITYRELNQKANTLAHKLRSLGVKSDDYVAIMAERSIEMIVGIYGIIKAGGAYVPVDPIYPKDRIDYMLADCTPKAALTYKAEIETEIPVIDLTDNSIFIGEAENPVRVNQSSDLLYVIYTSGTTGQPKGVMIEHKGVANTLQWRQQEYALKERDTVLQLFSFAFDGFVTSMFTPLLSGANVVIQSEEKARDILAIKQDITRYRVTHMIIVPVLYRELLNVLQPEDVRTLRIVTLAGEAVDQELIEQSLIKCPGTELTNEYGPTENSIATTIMRNLERQKNVSIGRPIDNAQVYILDGDNLQPIGVVGELCIAGRGIARGYLNRPELTEEKFIDNPFGEGKLYRSGDLARWLPDGNIEYLGRIDEQIKIRGFRIELGEIENVIRRAEGVTDAALIVREDKNGEKAICAYVTAENKLSISDLREEISKELPAYMIPAYIMQIDKIPVTRNGKLDKRALPEIEVKGEKEYITPRSETEEVLSEIFSEVLGVKKISIKDSFFELGGDSIKAIRIVSKMREAGYDLSVKEIMSKHTVEAIAYVAIAAAENNYEQHEVIGTVVATPILKTFEAWNLTKPSHFNQAMMVPVDVREETLKKVLEALVIHHDMLRAVYRNGTLEILNSRESKLYDFSVYDFNGEQNMKEKVEAECTRLQGSIDLESGPLLKTALFKTDVGKYLIICLHHLVVDGVSWRILLEDFTTAMKQVEAGEEIVLPKKTASYKAWSELLKEYKNSKNLIQEKGYWETVAEEMKSGRVEWDTDCTGTGYGNIGIFFDERETKKLLYEAGKAFNTEINDLLLSALGMAIRKLKGQTKVSIGLEGHGREEIHEPIEIDRTVGWFTSMYPVVVECKDDISESIIATKEMLRNVPNHGIGYGLLMEEDHGAKPDLYFNYLGELNSYTENESSRNITTFSTGLSIAEENRLPGTINFNGSIAQSKLCFVVTYDAKRYLEETINKLGVLYKEILIEIVEYCSNQKESTKTASDYSTNDLETSDLAVLRTRFSDIEDIYSLTALQEGMLFHNVMDRESTSYIVQSVYTLHGEVDNEKVGQALKFLARKHGVLRSAIAQQNISKPRQLVLENKKVEYEEINLTQLSESQQEKKISEVISLDVKRGFNLETDSLLRVKYIKLKNESHKLIWSFHHIIMDGWCISLVFGDFLRYYEQLKNDVSIEDIEHMIEKEKEKTAGYNEYAKWLEGQDKEKGLEYWTELLSEYEEPAEIRPMKKPALTDEQMGRIRVSLEKEISQRLNEMALSNNVTLNTVMEAAWGVVLQKYNGNDDVVFGKVVSGRTAKIKGIEEIVGLFVNTIPVRVKREADMTVVELLRVLQKQGIEGSSYDYCSLPEVQNQTKLGSALIKTLFAFENYYVDRERLKSSKNGLQIEMESTREQTNYTLNITAHFDGEKLYYDIMYNPNVYEKSEIQSILTRIKAVLQDMSLNPQKKLIEIETTTEEEKTLIVGEFNNTSSEYPREKTVAGLFEEQVEKTPNHIAVTFEDEEITYRELNQRANALAHKLRSLGVKPDDYVAIMAERSVEMIVGIYGIIKAGGAYVPMDPTYPKDRIEYMLEDCTPKAVLTYKAEIETEIPVIDLAEHSVFIGEEENPVQVNQSSDLLYVIYTSGTTGKPKGVMVENRGVIAMREYLMELYQITEKDNILQFANYIFDASVWEMTISLLTGATLKIASSEEISDVNVFNEFVSDSEITITLLSPQYYMQAKPEGLRILTTGGSASNAEIIKKASSDCRYINAYGPTENTVLATHWEYKNDDEFTDLIPIGKPISNTHIYILNEKNLCGIGIPGELCIAGDGVARGYLNRPELTAEKFIDNPFGEGKLYRSGDLARWLPDGNIEYLGRMDEQVKIRGFRIELGEIESVIRRVEGVTDVAVIVREDKNGEKAVRAYVTAENELSISDIKEVIRKELPEYMMPAYMMQIEKIPVTRNGKLDKRALPEIEVKSEKEYIAPRNETEEIVCEIFSELLDVEKISVKDNFFELGGHSLKATRLANRIEAETGKTMSLKEILSNPTVENLAEIMTGKKAEEYMPIPTAEIKAYYPMSSTQKRIYLLNQIDENSTAYNIPQSLKGTGDIRINDLKTAMQGLINRHEILRSVFVMIDGEPVQKIKETMELDFTLVEDERTDQKELMDRFIRPFDLSEGPLFRMEVVKRNDGYLLCIDMHHIISDGMSMVTFIKELTTLYNKENVKPLTHQYKDYSEWMRNRDLSEQKTYWLSQFEEEAPILDMPLDYTRPLQQSFAGASVYELTGKELASKIKAFAEKNKVTEYMVFLSAAMILLGKYSRQEDIVIGSPISARTHKDTENMLGMFVNTLAMRGRPEGQKTYRQFLEEIKESCLHAYENQEYPFEELVEEVVVHRDMSRNPLFDVMLVLQNNEHVELDLNGSKAESTEVECTVAKFDLTFSIYEAENTYQIALEYCADLYKKESAEFLLMHLINIMNQIVSNPTIKLNEIDVITKEETVLITENFNDTYSAYSKEKTVAKLFEEQVKKTPNHIAVTFEDEEITYRELNQRANALAHKLRSLGVKPDDYVAIMAERSIEMIVGIYGVIKAGGAYVPMDPTYPKDRIEYMMEDCTPKAVLTYKAEIETAIPVIDLAEHSVFIGEEENPIQVNQSSDLLYVIYTSGTTGKPKGVMIENRGVANLRNYFIKSLQVKEGEAVLQFANIIFDGSVWEMNMALLTGGRLVIANKAEREDTKEFVKIANREKISISTIPPVFYSDMDEFIPNVVITAGSESNRGMVEKIVRNSKYINAYGPSECTVAVTHWECDSNDIVPERIPIGKPILNTKVYILNNKKLCGIGVPGELCIAGDGVARGYLNRPELTAEKFIDNPFGEGKLYRSGDLVRWLPDGNIEYLGRIDEQVKIRGFRIELGEIESVIRRVEGVTDVAVIVREDKNGEKAVRAYVTAENELSISDIKEGIRKELPEYMIPAYMMQIEKIPVTRNGKLDKRALPEIEMKSEKEYIPPRNETEEKLCEIIGESLNVKQIGIEDNIFELGANSISIINIVGRVIRAGINITIQNIYENQTVKSLYEYLNGKSEYFEKYDEMHFEKYNKLLTTNQFDNEAKIITNNLGNVLVTGATGFLGAHIVANLIDNEEGKVYCLIRCENENHGYNRLRNILNHYFGKKYDSILGERIIIVSGDVSMTNLENILPLDIKTIIHSAANTKHYGLYMDFHKINVDGTKNIVEYAKEVNATLIHISTISVCSVLPVDAENHIFTERDYFKNQIIDVPYVRSKFFAEKVVLDAIESGLDAVVIRIGNQTNRSRDLKTMIDYQQNRFNYSIKNIVKIGYIKESMLNEKLELSPINETALGVIALSKKRVKQYNMFHLSNDNLVSFNKICKAFEHIGICLNVVDDNGYANIIKNIESNKKDSINNLVALGATGRETKAVALDNSFTANFLKKIGFTWSKIDQDYLNKWAMHYAAMGYWE